MIEHQRAEERKAESAEVADAKELDQYLRAALRRYIFETTSIKKAAEKLGVVSGTLRQFLAGLTDTGLRRSLLWAATLGLSPRAWFKKAGLYSEIVTYSEAIRSALDLTLPKNPLLLECASEAQKLPLRPLEPPRLSEIITKIEDKFLEDPRSAGDLAEKQLKSQLKRLRKNRRNREEIEPNELSRFYSLLAAYGLCRHSNTAPLDWAWSIAQALDYFQDAGDSAPLTWLLIDGSMALRRQFKPKESLAWAKVATSSALSQDLHRLYPRALLTFASILFSIGSYRAATAVDEEILNRPGTNPYQPLAAYSAAVALARIDAEAAARLLSKYRSLLDLLPPHRQLQCYWTEARVLAEQNFKEPAFEAYINALSVGTIENSDVRDFFLIFEEARQLVGSNDPRLEKIADDLKTHLIKMSFEFPNEYLAAAEYLRFFRKKSDEQLRTLIKLVCAKQK